MATTEEPQAAGSDDKPVNSTSAGVTVLKAATAFQRLHLRSMRSPTRAKLQVTTMTQRGLDSARRQARAYEYLCHLEEAKRWMEACLQENLPSPELMEEQLVNGVVLVKLAAFFAPKFVKKKNIFDPDMAQYKARGKNFRHTDNVMQWINAMKHINFPELYHPSVTDCYENKNMPRVIYCIHALSQYLNKLGVAPEIESLHGVAEFTEEELERMNRKIDKCGVAMPQFNSISVPEPPTPVKKMTSLELPAPLPKPKAPYKIYWPFYPEAHEAWMENDFSLEEAKELRHTLVKVKKHKSRDQIEQEEREEEELRVDREYSAEEAETEMIELLNDHFPHLVAFWTTEAEPTIADDDASGDIPVASAVAVEGDGEAEPEDIERIDAMFEQEARKNMFWDHLYWGRARRYFVHWPFRLDDEDEELFASEDESEGEEEDGYEVVWVDQMRDQMLLKCQAELNDVLRERRMALLDVIEEEAASTGTGVARGSRILTHEKALDLSGSLDPHAPLEAFLRQNFEHLYKNIKRVSEVSEVPEESDEDGAHDALESGGVPAESEPGVHRARTGEFLLTRAEEFWDGMWWGHTAESNRLVDDAKSKLSEVLETAKASTPKLRRRTMASVSYVRTSSPNVTPGKLGSTGSPMLSRTSRTNISHVASPLSSATTSRTVSPDRDNSNTGSSSNNNSSNNLESTNGLGPRSNSHSLEPQQQHHPLTAARLGAIRKKQELLDRLKVSNDGLAVDSTNHVDLPRIEVPAQAEAAHARQGGGVDNSTVGSSGTINTVMTDGCDSIGAPSTSVPSSTPLTASVASPSSAHPPASLTSNNPTNNLANNPKLITADDRQGSLAARELINQSAGELADIFGEASPAIKQTLDPAGLAKPSMTDMRHGSFLARQVIADHETELQTLFEEGSPSRPAKEEVVANGAPAEGVQGLAQAMANAVAPPSVKAVQQLAQSESGGSPRNRRKLPTPGSPRRSRSASASSSNSSGRRPSVGNAPGSPAEAGRGRRRLPSVPAMSSTKSTPPLAKKRSSQSQLDDDEEDEKA